MSSRKYQILAALMALTVFGGLVYQDRKIRALESRIETLQVALKEKEDVRVSPPRLRDPQHEHPADGNGEKAGGEPAAPGRAADSYQVLKELDADAATDPRSYAEKLQELLAGNPTEEKAAIACRFIFNKAADRQGLPDYALQSIYGDQRNPDLKRVIAQVLSQRGNDALLNDLIAEAQTTLKSSKPADRLDALGQIGKIHSVHAVEAIAPLLQDSDSTVRVAALLALRDSGNQRHVSLVEPLINDPDAAVSTLAGNVASALGNLSSSARTSYSRADIEAELPPIANP
jgi:HEAT repeats